MLLAAASDGEETDRATMLLLMVNHLCYSEEQNSPWGGGTFSFGCCLAAVLQF